MRAGEWVLVELVNEDAVVRDWMVQGVPNLDLVARPGQTVRMRFVLDAPGTYVVNGAMAGGGDSGAAMLVVDPR